MPNPRPFEPFLSSQRYLKGSYRILARLNKSLYSGGMNKEVAEHRLRVLKFWKSHGLAATKDAFKASRSSLYRWQSSYNLGRGQTSSLTPKSRARSTNNSRTVDPRLVAEIIHLRTTYPRLGKEKLHPLIREYAGTLDVSPPCVSTIGRVLSDLKRGGRLPSHSRVRYNSSLEEIREITRKRKPKTRRSGYQPQHPGDLLQIDTVITHTGGLRRYTLTAIDCTSRFAFAWSYNNGTSASARDFFRRLEVVAPFSVKHVQTDNGSEFMELFRDHLEAAGVTHFFNYPRRPQWNGTVERFNRTIQDEFLSWHKETLAEDLEQFNHLLAEWLLWYNSKRLHYSLRSTPLDYLVRKHGLSQIAWTHTGRCRRVQAVA